MTGAEVHWLIFSVLCSAVSSGQASIPLGEQLPVSIRIRSKKRVFALAGIRRPLEASRKPGALAGKRKKPKFTPGYGKKILPSAFTCGFGERLNYYLVLRYYLVWSHLPEQTTQTLLVQSSLEDYGICLWETGVAAGSYKTGYSLSLSSSLCWPQEETGDTN